MEKRYRRTLVFIFNYSALASLLIFIFYKGVGQRDLPYILVLSGFFILTAANLILLYKKNTIELSSWFTSILMFFLDLYLFILAPEQGYALLWFYILPPVSILLIQEKGVYLSILFIILTVLIYFLFPNLLVYKLPLKFFVRLIVTNLVLIYLLYFFDKMRRNYESQLAKNIDELQKSYEEIAVTEEELRERQEEMQILMEEIKRKEAYLQRLLSHLPDGFAIVDLKGRIKFVNKATQNIFGDIKDLHYSKLFDESENKKILKAIGKVFHGQSTVIEVTAKSLDGSEIYLLTTLYPEYDEENQIAGVAIIFKDITEIKKLQTKLEIEYKRIRDLIDNIPAYIYFKDEKLRFLVVNEQFAKFVKIDNRDKLIGHKLSDFYPDNEKIKKAEEQERQIMEKGKSIIDMEITCAEHGEKRWLRATKIPFYDKDGKITGLIAIVIDITNDKLKTEQIKQLNNKLIKFYEAVENSSVGILITDAQGVAEYANKAYMEIAGYQMDAIKRISQVLSKSNRHPKGLLEKFYEAVRKKQGFSMNIVHLRKTDNKILHLNIIVSPVRNESTREIEGYVLITNDITDLVKEKEKVEQLNKNILQSINYARAIQQSILKGNLDLSLYFRDMFIIYQPKEIIGGDFYYFQRIENHIYLAVADCTGHGVPGALISVVGYHLIDETIKENPSAEPHQILEKLREDVKDIFVEFRGGMDMALCKIDLHSLKLQFSGAFLPVFVSRNNEIIELKHTKSPVGYYPIEHQFVTHNFQLQKGDVIYLFSDGYYDQLFYDEKRKRFAKLTSIGFKELLKSISDLPLHQQEQILKNRLQDILQNNPQTDDITIIAVEV